MEVVGRSRLLYVDSISLPSASAQNGPDFVYGILTPRARNLSMRQTLENLDGCCDIGVGC